jgi:anaerobic selenocysteine-containing dehydrogenase
VPLRVHQDIILTDQMFLEPKEEVLLLPARTRYEQEGGGIETTTERRIIFSPEIPRPAEEIGEAKSEWRILLELAAAAYPERAVQLGCASGQAIRDEIIKVVPFYAGAEKLDKTGDAVQYGGPHLCANGQFSTPDGKGRFRVVELPGEGGTRRARDGMRKGESAEIWHRLPFLVSTRRGKQFNTLIYDETDPLTGAERDAVFMNAEDAAALHLRNRDRVALVNGVGRFEGRVFLAPIARGNLQVHWPEGNAIIRKGVVDTMGGVPDYNALARVERLAEG